MNLHPPKEMDFVSSNMSDSWTRFKKAFTIYGHAIDLFNANTSEKRRIGVLLHCIGEQGQLIYDNLTWTNPGDNDKYEEVIKNFDAEFNPIKNTTYERFKFNSCIQEVGQSITSPN